VDKCKETIDSGNDIAVIDVEKEIYDEMNLLRSLKLQTVDFIEGQCPAPKQLQNEVGTLTIQGGQGMTAS